MPKLKTGEEITWKEAWLRFRKGIDNLTPLQKIQNEKRSTFIVLIGFIVGLGGLIYFFNDFPSPPFTIGLILIFLGNSWSTLLKWLALREQHKILKEINRDSVNDSIEEMEWKENDIKK